MFESIWREFVDAKVAEEYYFLYIHNSQHWLFAINAICLVTSLTGIVSLAADYLSPLLSSLVILIPQIVGILQPLYPYGNRLYAAKLIFKDVQAKNLETEQMINQYLYGALSENDLLHVLKNPQNNLPTMEEKYADPDLFPRNYRLHEKAQVNVSQYLTSHFDLGGWKYE